MESEPNEREWELAQAALNQYVGADKPGSFGVDDKFLGIIRGLLASYRAELTAPAGDDVGRLLEEFCGVVLDAPTWDRLCEKVQAALTVARKDAIDEEVITADQFFRAAKAEAEHYKARAEALEAAAREAYDYGYRIGQDEGYSTDPDYISPIRKEIRVC